MAVANVMNKKVFTRQENLTRIGARSKTKSFLVFRGAVPHLASVLR
jgi:hypothetical protein